MSALSRTLPTIGGVGAMFLGAAALPLAAAPPWKDGQENFIAPVALGIGLGGGAVIGKMTGLGVGKGMGCALGGAVTGAAVLWIALNGLHGA